MNTPHTNQAKEATMAGKVRRFFPTVTVDLTEDLEFVFSVRSEHLAWIKINDIDSITRLVKTFGIKRFELGATVENPGLVGHRELDGMLEAHLDEAIFRAWDLG